MNDNYALVQKMKITSPVPNNHEYHYSIPPTEPRLPIAKTNLEKDLEVNIDMQLKLDI